MKRIFIINSKYFQERYKTDMALAITLLQCKPDSFVSQKVASVIKNIHFFFFLENLNTVFLKKLQLPQEVQSKVSRYVRLDTNSHSDSEGSTSGVGVATKASYHVLPASDSPVSTCPFPPTAMVYAMRGIGKLNLPISNYFFNI